MPTRAKKSIASSTVPDRDVTTHCARPSEVLTAGVLRAGARYDEPNACAESAAVSKPNVLTSIINYYRARARRPANARRTTGRIRGLPILLIWVRARPGMSCVVAALRDGQGAGTAHPPTTRRAAAGRRASRATMTRRSGGT